MYASSSKLFCWAFVLWTSIAARSLAGSGTDFWAFQPLQDCVPFATTEGHPRNLCNIVDKFIVKNLAEKQLDLSPPADRRTLLRRVTFDLTGLPPSPEELNTFLADEAPDAFGRVVDRLLSSPRYGERWGRHWLDLVRYADTSGNSGDFPIPSAWRYRNYVINAFNQDRPFDEFLRQQIAGDHLPFTSSKQRYENLVATGYLAISRRFGVKEKQFHLTIEDTITNVGQAILGLSIHCARCHDHKFDEITNEDYYALYGIFQSTQYAFPGTEVFPSPKNFVALVDDQQLEMVVKPFEQRVKTLEAEVERLRLLTLRTPDGPNRDKAVEDHERAKRQRIELLKNTPIYPKAYGVGDAKVMNARIHVQGNPADLGNEVPRRFLAVFGNPTMSPGTSSSGRLELANCLTSPSIRPLTARVLANRIWQHHFGQGLVQTPNDFGVQGQPPTHPNLLDFLARQLINANWSIKHVHRLILLSRTYHQASDICTELKSDKARDAHSIDPNNELLWKFSRRRLTAEEIRDSVLLVSNQLDLSFPHGHAFPPEHEWKFGQHTPYVGQHPSRHRSVYMMRQRLKRNPFLAVFDAADPNVATGQRSSSTTPLQALWLMNNSDFHSYAYAFTDRLLEYSEDDLHRVHRAYILLVGRSPSEKESELAMAFLDAYPRKPSSEELRYQSRQQAWTSLLRIFMSSNEFLHVE